MLREVVSNNVRLIGPAPTADTAAPQSGPVKARLPAVRVREATFRRERVIAQFLGGYEADVFRTLRSLVLKRMAERGARTLGICSPREGDGKSVVALNLALSLSFDVNHTVLLVELDFRYPRLHQRLGLKVKKGLADVLNGTATVAECMVDLGYDRLSVLPARTSLSRSSETLASPAMAELTKELRENYPDRLIIYDLPPVLLSDDMLASMSHLDALLMVVGAGKTGTNDLERALALTGRDKMIGTVLNAVKYGLDKPSYYNARR